MLFRFNYLERTDNLIKCAQTVVQACHKYGIRVLEHLDLTIPAYCGYPDMEKHLGWLQQDARTGERYFWFCFNNPEFRKWMLDYLENYVRATNVDAVMIDELHYSGEFTCGCKYCREKFHKDTGYTIPYDGNSRFWTDNSLPEKLAFIRWRMKSLGDFQKVIVQRLRKINKKIVFMTYSTDFLNPFSYLRGGCLWEAARNYNFIGYEVWERIAPFESYTSILGAMKTRRAIGNYYHNPTWIIPYGRSKSQREFGAILANMSHCFIWGPSPFLQWPFKMDSKRVNTIADVALLASLQTRNGNVSPWAQYYPVNGWLTFLIEQNIQFDILMDLNLNKEQLKKYKILILAAARCLSRAQAEAIKAFAKSGGLVIFSYDTGLADENAHPKQPDLLTELMGIKAGRITSGKFKLEFSAPELKPACGTVELKRIIRVSVPEPHSQTKLLGWASRHKEKLPLLLTRPYGKGRLIYCSAMISGNTYRPEIIRDRKYTYSATPEIIELMKKLVVLKDGFRIKIKGPQKLICYAYKENSTSPRVVLHCLNMSGHKLSQGQIIRGALDIPYPSLDKDVEFSIETGFKPDKVYLGNMDSDQEIPVDFKNTGKTTTFRISGKYFKKYTVIFIQ